MDKYKCEKCEHVADTKGFCPTDGSALVEVKGGNLDALMKQIGQVVKQNVDDTLKSYGIDKDNPGIMPKAGKLPQSKAEKLEFVKGLLSDSDRKHLESLEEKEAAKFLKKAKVAHFFKNVVAFNIHKDPEYLNNIKALAEGVDADGGYLTPTEFRALLVEDQLDKPFLRNLVTVIPMSSNSLELPTLASGVKTSWGSENTSINTTTARFGTLTLAPKRLNTFLYTSRELVADSALNVVNLITRLFVEAMGREEDRVIVNGSGTGQPKGILQETLGGIDNANVDANTPDNIRKLPLKLAKSYRQNGRWLANSLALQQIVAMKDSQNRYLLGSLADGVTQTLAGYPVEEQNDVPVDTLVFGDMRQYYLGDREQISVETTTEGAGTFEKHQVAIKVVERIDGKVAQTNAFKTLTNCGFD